MADGGQEVEGSQGEVTTPAPAPAPAADVFHPLAIAPSTNVAAVWYNESAQTLRVQFHRNNRTYEYYQVQADVAAGFEHSRLSAGKYLNLYVAGVFPYAEI